MKDSEKIQCLRCGAEAVPYAPTQTLIKRYSCTAIGCGFTWQIVYEAGLGWEYCQTVYQYGKRMGCHRVPEGTLLVASDEKIS